MTIISCFDFDFFKLIVSKQLVAVCVSFFKATAQWLKKPEQHFPCLILSIKWSVKLTSGSAVGFRGDDEVRASVQEGLVKPGKLEWQQSLLNFHSISGLDV